MPQELASRAQYSFGSLSITLLLQFGLTVPPSDRDVSWIITTCTAYTYDQLPVAFSCDEQDQLIILGMSGIAEGMR